MEKGGINLFSIYPDLNHETLRRPGLAWNRNEQCISKAQRVRNAALLCNQTLCFRKRCAITKYSKVQTDAAIHQRSTMCEVQHFRNRLMWYKVLYCTSVLIWNIEKWKLRIWQRNGSRWKIKVTWETFYEMQCILGKVLRRKSSAHCNASYQCGNGKLNASSWNLIERNLL